MSQSETLFSRAERVIPGGVNSPVRAFKSVGSEPVFIKRGEGAYMIDEDNNRYIDYIGSWGPLILGHAHPAVIEAVTKTAKDGLSFGAATKLEVEMAEKLCELIPSLEQVRMVNSGTEATMTAIRLARGHTGRNKIIKFEACYHGHADSLLVKAGSGLLTLGIPNCPGVPAAFVEQTLTARFNHLEEVEALFQEHGDDIAAIIVEPIAGNSGCLLPKPEFLPGLRQLCDNYGSVLIFDEVMTGFRVALGGAQAVYNVTPDLSTYSKVMGGGMPVGAFGGKREIMQKLAPVGQVYQAGTLSGNPIAMAAGLANLNEISKPGFFDKVSKQTETLLQGLHAKAETAGVSLRSNQAGAMFGFYFSDQKEIYFAEQIDQTHVDKYNQFFRSMLKQGVYLAPSAYESGFVSIAHTDNIIEQTITAAAKAFGDLT